MVKPVFAYGLQPDAKAIREEVFMKEQGFQNEFQDNEDSFLNLVLYLDGSPISTGRLSEVDPETYQVSRLAVLKPYRNMQIGTYTMKFLINKAISLGARKVILGAQVSKQSFYESLGFRPNAEGEVYLDEGVPHIMMWKDVVNNRYPYRRKNKKQ